MHTLLNDIELDIQELKCLVHAVESDANPALRTVAKRHIQQMRTRLDTLQEMMEEAPAPKAVPLQEPLPQVAVQHSPTPPTTAPQAPAATAAAVTTPTAGVSQPSPILGERILPAADLRRAVSLNDSFRFTRELFNGDAARMNDTLQRLGNAASMDEAVGILAAEVHADDDNQALADLLELLKKYFS